ncbi:glycohydrolase toxin TNT-related protein [Microbacterium gilvum]|uniref:Uncharacterized protein n=1 Tax=Microbacterium gilvum TaxID=1336204 RepID=A0ABP9A285_9MICO
MSGTQVKITAATIEADAISYRTAATQLEGAIAAARSTLSANQGMAGDDNAAEDFAQGDDGYDVCATATLQSAQSIANAYYILAAMLENVSRTYVAAEGAGAGETRAIVQSTAPEVVEGDAPDAPTALGAGWPGPLGEFQEIIEWGLQQVGVVIPTGDEDKLRGGAEAWDALADAVSTAHTTASSGTDWMGGMSIPQVASIQNAHSSIQISALQLQTSAGDMAGWVRDYITELGKMRERLKDFLQQLAIEIAADIALSGLLGALSFGLGALAGAAKAMATVVKWCNRIKDLIDNLRDMLRALRAARGGRAMFKRALIEGAQGGVASAISTTAMNVMHAEPDGVYQQQNVLDAFISASVGGMVASPIANRIGGPGGPGFRAGAREVGGETVAGAAEGIVDATYQTAVNGQEFNPLSAAVGGALLGAGLSTGMRGGSSALNLGGRALGIDTRSVLPNAAGDQSGTASPSQNAGSTTSLPDGPAPAAGGVGATSPGGGGASVGDYDGPTPGGVGSGGSSSGGGAAGTSDYDGPTPGSADAGSGGGADGGSVDVPTDATPDAPSELPSDGVPADGAPADGAPADGAPADGAPADGAPADGAPADGAPVDGTPVDGTPVDGTPVDGTPVDGTPVDGTPVDGTPVDGTPADGTPVDGTPVDGTPVDGTPADGTPADGAPADGIPADGTPADGIPADGTPADGTPADGTPADGTPADGMPADGTPADATPEDTAPADGASVDGASADAPPADAAPADATPDDTAPADAAPAGATGHAAPAHHATPGESASVDEASTGTDTSSEHPDTEQPDTDQAGVEQSAAETAPTADDADQPDAPADDPDAEVDAEDAAAAAAASAAGAGVLAAPGLAPATPRGTTAGTGTPASTAGQASPAHADHPMDSDAQFGDGWERAESPASSNPIDPAYGLPRAPGTSGHLAPPYGHPGTVRPEIAHLISDPSAPFGRDENGVPLPDQAAWEARYTDANGYPVYPGNAGGEPGSFRRITDIDVFHTHFGEQIDRMGSPKGDYFSLPGTSFEGRALPLGSLNADYTIRDLVSLPPGGSIEISQIAPAFGRDGGGLQIRILDSDGNPQSQAQLEHDGHLAEPAPQDGPDDATADPASSTPDDATAQPAPLESPAPHHTPEQIQDALDQALQQSNTGYDPYDLSNGYAENCGTVAANMHDFLNGQPLQDAGTGTLDIAGMEARTGLPQTPVTPAQIEASLRAQGPGAHCVVGIDRAGDADGHWFNAVHDGEQVWVVDGQDGTRSPWPPDEPDAVTWDASIDPADVVDPPAADSAPVDSSPIDSAPDDGDPGARGAGPAPRPTVAHPGTFTPSAATPTVSVTESGQSYTQADVQAALDRAPQDDAGRPVDHRDGTPLALENADGGRGWHMRWDEVGGTWVAENPGSGDGASGSSTRLDDGRRPDDLDDAEWRDQVSQLDDRRLAELLRARTPDQAMRDAVQGPLGDDGLQPDPLYPDEQDLRRERLEADHIIPLRRIVEMDGFRDLTWSQMLEVVNLPENFLGLSDRVNASKGDRMPGEWDGHSEFGPLSPERRRWLDERSLDALDALEEKIIGFTG